MKEERERRSVVILPLNPSGVVKDDSKIWSDLRGGTEALKNVSVYDDVC